MTHKWQFSKLGDPDHWEVGPLDYVTLIPIEKSRVRIWILRRLFPSRSYVQIRRRVYVLRDF